MPEDFVSNPYKKEEKKTLGEVVISQIDVCRKEFNKELKKGFQQQVIISGKVVTVNVPDQRQTNIQCTKTLHDLLMFFFDKKFDDRLKEIKNKIKESAEKYLKTYIAIEPNLKLKEIAEKMKMIQNSPSGDRIFQQLMNYQSEIYREMFQELILLFKRKNELSGKRMLGHKD